MKSGPYDDIINLPHHVSSTRQRMPRENRAAQFAPFAALTGYDSAISETARLVDARIELGEDALIALDAKLRILGDKIAERPEVSVTHFLPDERKQGGSYVTATGALKKIDEHERVLVFVDGRRLAMEDILEIESELLGPLTGENPI